MKYQWLITIIIKKIINMNNFIFSVLRILYNEKNINRLIVINVIIIF